jgi:hypothetical protein
MAITRFTGLHESQVVVRQKKKHIDIDFLILLDGATWLLKRRLAHVFMWDPIELMSQ